MFTNSKTHAIEDIHGKLTWGKSDGASAQEFYTILSLQVYNWEFLK